MRQATCMFRVGTVPGLTPGSVSHADDPPMASLFHADLSARRVCLIWIKARSSPSFTAAEREMCWSPLRSGEVKMDSGLRQEILSILKAAGEMTIATVRPDGYPQATTVNYVSDGLVIYFGCAADSQKVRNITCNDKVSLTVTPPHFNWEDIRGLSIGGKAPPVTEPQEINRVSELMLRKFPQILRYALAQ